jgi:hypothetical protein
MSVNVDLLKKKAPKFLSKINHIDCESGWQNLLSELVWLIENHINFSVPDELKEHLYAVQIKEKFASLRVYCNQQTPYMEGAIDLASNLAEKTCELCGNPGSIDKTGLRIIVLCASCKVVK